MKSYLITGMLTLSISFATIGCESASQRATQSTLDYADKMIYGLGDDDLNYLGKRLGCQVEALGMSGYVFTGRDYDFGVVAHNDISVQNRVQADEPVVLRYKSSDGKRSFESQLPISHGVKLATVEDHFRGFIRRIEEAKK